jgi:hypothetical protein
MDFDDVSRVVPWIETSTDLGLDLTAEQRANPRLFKSHLDADRIPKGGRYIISCREPGDAIYSMYRFMEGWFLEPGAISADEFVQGTMLADGTAVDPAGGTYWSHLKSWWLRRNDPDVLFMAYEHMKDDLTGTIRRVAALLEIDLDDDLLAITEKQSSLAFMQAHKDRFDDKLMREHSVVAVGLPADSESSKVRTGQSGDSAQQLSEGTRQQIQALWHRYITPDLGFEDYPAMIASLER